MRASIATALFLAACAAAPTGLDNLPPITPPPPPPPPTPMAANPLLDAQGAWVMTRTVTSVSPGCPVPVGQKTTSPIQIYQSGSYPTYLVTAAGYGGSYDSFLGGILKKTRYMYLDGRYPLDGGTLVSAQVLAWPDNNTLMGTESWAWSGPGGSCTGGTAEIVGKRGF
jgi:hypothetical protein